MLEMQIMFENFQPSVAIFRVPTLIFTAWNPFILDAGNQLFYSHFVDRPEPVWEFLKRLRRPGLPGPPFFFIDRSLNSITRCDWYPLLGS